MSEVQQWCQRNRATIKALVASFSANNPGREVREPSNVNDILVRISGEINSELGTLRYIRKNNKLMHDIKDLVESGRSPDLGFFGPSPGVADAAGMGTAFGVAADLGSALLTIFKGVRADRKLRKELKADASLYKQQVVKDYCDLVVILEIVVQLGSESEQSAKKLESSGLNSTILNNSWRVVKCYSWLVLVS